MKQESSSGPILVIGMHRSGTSMLSNILNKLGVFMGDVQDANFETHLLVNSNEFLLRNAGAGWDVPMAFEKLLEKPQVNDEYTEHLYGMLKGQYMELFLGKERFKNYKTIINLDEKWGAKDPRLTFTLPVWRRILPECRIIHVYRHGVDVAQSLMVRHLQMLKDVMRQYNIDQMPDDYRFHAGMVAYTDRCETLDGAFSLWQEYINQAKKHVVDMEHNALEISYESILLEPVKVIGSIAKFCDVECDEATYQSIARPIKAENAYKYKSNDLLLGFTRSKVNELAVYGY